MKSAFLYGFVYRMLITIIGLTLSAFWIYREDLFVQTSSHIVLIVVFVYLLVAGVVIQCAQHYWKPMLVELGFWSVKNFAIIFLLESSILFMTSFLIGYFSFSN